VNDKQPEKIVICGKWPKAEICAKVLKGPRGYFFDSPCGVYLHCNEMGCWDV